MQLHIECASYYIPNLKVVIFVSQVLCVKITLPLLNTPVTPSHLVKKKLEVDNILVLYPLMDWLTRWWLVFYDQYRIEVLYLRMISKKKRKNTE